MVKIEKTLDLGWSMNYKIDISPQSGFAIGKVHGIGTRNIQQDAFGISDVTIESVEKNGLLLVLADGMGGMQHGEKASMAAVVTCLEYFEHHTMQKNVKEELQEMLYRANDQVRISLDQDADEGGSTLIAVAIKNTAANWISVGDSRLYLLRNEKLLQLNKEHNYALILSEMVKEGMITEEEAKKDPRRKALISYMGMPDISEIDINKETLFLEKGDRLLLMSDGVFDTLSSKEIIMSVMHPAEEAAFNLGMKIEQKKKPYQDNYTAIIVEII